MEAVDNALQSSKLRPNDGILVIAARAEPTGTAKFSNVLTQLSARRVRLFTLYLAAVLAGTYHTEIDWGAPFGPRSHTTFATNRESIGFLTQESGGFIFIEPTDDPWRTYRPKPERVEALKRIIYRMYAAIAEHYRVRVSGRGGQHLEIDMQASIRKKVPQATFFYSRVLPSCSGNGP